MGRAKVHDELLTVTCEHTEHDTTAEIAKRCLKESCRKRAAEIGTSTLRQIFDEEVHSFPHAASVSFVDIESSMYKRRRRALPELPRDVDEVCTLISSSLYASLESQPFFRGEVGDGEAGRAFLFASNGQLEALNSHRDLHIDATFKVVPGLFYQLLTIMIETGDYCFPVCFALMTRKSGTLYVSVFQKIRELVPGFTPLSIMTGYEEALPNALREVFGQQTQISGCFFHYTQAIIRKFRQMGLSRDARISETMQLILRCLLVLPLLPTEDIKLGSHDIQAIIPEVRDDDRQSAINLTAYVDRQWLRKATIGPDRLSVHRRRSRTNNGIESYHAMLLRRIKAAHPNLYTFLEHLQNVTRDSMHDLSRLNNGLRIRRPKKK